MHNIVYSFKNSKRVEKRYKVEYGNPVSAAELKVIDALKILKVKYHAEIYFPNFRTPQGGHYRYDFILPNQGIVIEYDGVHFHKNRKKNDNIKTNYCKVHSIPLYRFSGSDFYNMTQLIRDILPENYIQKEKQEPIKAVVIPQKKEKLVIKMVMKTTIQHIKLTPQQQKKKNQEIMQGKKLQYSRLHR